MYVRARHMKAENSDRSLEVTERSAQKFRAGLMVTMSATIYPRISFLHHWTVASCKYSCSFENLKKLRDSGFQNEQ